MSKIKLIAIIGGIVVIAAICIYYLNPFRNLAPTLSSLSSQKSVEVNLQEIKKKMTPEIRQCIIDKLGKAEAKKLLEEAKQTKTISPQMMAQIRPCLGGEPTGSLLPILGTDKPSVTPSSGIALGIYQPQDNTYDGKAIDRYIKEVDNKKPAFAWLPMSWKSYDSDIYKPFNPQMLEEFRIRGIMPGLTWDASRGSTEKYPNRQDAINQTEFSWKAIISGKHDEYITQFAKDAAAYHYPFILRILHEMNGTWYPWGYQVNGNTNIADYVTAWKHIVDIFRKENATNVQFVWNPTTMDTENIQTYGTMLTQAYPGDNYVDWVGLDGYSNPKNGWMSLQDRFQPSYQLVTSFSNRPMMFFEVGSLEKENPPDPTAKPNWITQGFLTTIPNLFPEVKVAVWFNSKDGSGQNFSIDTPPEVLAAWKQVVDSPLYQGSLLK